MSVQHKPSRHPELINTVEMTEGEAWYVLDRLNGDIADMKRHGHQYAAAMELPELKTFKDRMARFVRRFDAEGGKR